MIWLRCLEIHTHKVKVRYISYVNKIRVRKTGEEGKKAVLLSDEEKSRSFKDLNSLTLICLVPWASYLTFFVWCSFSI